MDGTKQAHLVEYEKLKKEQGRRIQFRDNMRYVTLAAIGVVAAQAGRSSPELLLVIPWICLILGWNYVANAGAVKRIGEHIEGPLSKAVSASAGDDRVFQWESFRRDERDAARRVRQLVVDEITFFFPGVMALVSSVPACGVRTSGG